MAGPAGLDYFSLRQTNIRRVAVGKVYAPLAVYSRPEQGNLSSHQFVPSVG